MVACTYHRHLQSLILKIHFSNVQSFFRSQVINKNKLDQLFDSMSWSFCVVCLCRLLKDVASSRSVIQTVGDTDQKAELVSTLIATAGS